MGANNLQTLRNSILTSIHGRRIGLDVNDYLKGPKALASAVQALTSVDSTGTSIPNYGIAGLELTTLATTVNATLGTTEVGFAYLLDAPEPGVEKILYMSSGHSTAAASFTFGSAATAIWTSLGTTFTGVNFIAKGQFVQLVGLSTAKWLVKAFSTGASLASSN